MFLLTLLYYNTMINYLIYCLVGRDLLSKCNSQMVFKILRKSLHPVRVLRCLR